MDISREREWRKLWLQILLPNGGIVALFTRSSDNLVAYLDESIENQSLPVMSVAGYLFEPEPYLKFCNGMDALLGPMGIQYFRMFECNDASGQFLGKTKDQ